MPVADVALSICGRCITHYEIHITVCGDVTFRYGGETRGCNTMGEAQQERSSAAATNEDDPLPAIRGNSYPCDGVEVWVEGRPGIEDGGEGSAKVLR